MYRRCRERYTSTVSRTWRSPPTLGRTGGKMIQWKDIRLGKLLQGSKNIQNTNRLSRKPPKTFVVRTTSNTPSRKVQHEELGKISNPLYKNPHVSQSECRTLFTSLWHLHTHSQLNTLAAVRMHQALCGSHHNTTQGTGNPLNFCSKTNNQQCGKTSSV